MKQDYMDIDLDSALCEMKRLRYEVSPITALLLIMDYTQKELETSISKIDEKTMSRLDLRYNLAKNLLDRHWQKLTYHNLGQENEFSNIPSKTYTVSTAAQAIGVSEGTIRNAINNGKLKYSDVSATGNRKYIRISQKDVDEYIKHKK